MSKTRVEGNKVFIILEADSSSIHPDARCQQRVDLKKPSKRILVITSYPSQATSARIRSCRIKPQTKPSSNKAQQTQMQSFPSHSSPDACSFIPKDVFWRSSDQEARSNRKKQIPAHFPPILCMVTPPVVRSQRESKYQTIVQEAQRKREMSADK